MIELNAGGGKMSVNLKDKVLLIQRERGLYSCMNNTKWNELRYAMLEEMPFPPQYVIKSLLSESCRIEDEILSDSNEFGDWYYFGSTADIEWIKIRPRYKRRGESAVDASDRLAGLLEKYNIPYERDGAVFTVYGYR